MSEQDDHPAAKRQQIIHGAERAFTKSGYEGASMSQIASEAGVSKGTLYNYFDNKATLFAAFVEQKVADTVGQIFLTIDEEEDAEIALRSIAMRMLDMMISPHNLVLYRIVISEASKFPHLAETFWRSGPSRAIAFMTEWVRRQVSSGRLVAPDPEFAAEQFLALCQTRIALRKRLQISRPGEANDIAQVAAGAVSLFLAGYGTGSLASNRLKS